MHQENSQLCEHPAPESLSRLQPFYTTGNQPEQQA